MPALLDTRDAFQTNLAAGCLHQNDQTRTSQRACETECWSPAPATYRKSCSPSAALEGSTASPRISVPKSTPEAVGAQLTLYSF